jgi:predicted nucleotide-binding protein
MALHAELTVQQMEHGVTRLEKRLEEVKAFDPRQVTEKRRHPALDKLKASIEDALGRTYGKNTVEYARYASAASFSTGPVYMDRFPPVSEIQQAVKASQDRSIALLEQAIESLNEQIAESHLSTVVTQDTGSVSPLTISRKVFVVHGHDEGARETVARYLERLGFEAVILHEQANQGRTVIEKIEAHGNVGFAVVLLTPDDYGGKVGGESRPRARQNVVLELGYFVGRLGRGHVCALLRGELEIPSDFAGVVYQPMDDAGGWKGALAKELSVAGHDIDWSKVVG